MSFLDIVIGILLVWGLYRGLKNGLFVEIASLAALIAGLYGAFHFSYIAGDYIADHMDWGDQYVKISAFLITFFAIILVVNLLGHFFTKIADFAMLGLVNKIAGGIFGALKVAVILGALLIFFDRLNTSFSFINEETKKESIFYEPVKEIGAFVFSLVLEKKEEESPQPANMQVI